MSSASEVMMWMQYHYINVIRIEGIECPNQTTTILHSEYLWFS